MPKYHSRGNRGTKHDDHNLMPPGIFHKRRKPRSTQKRAHFISDHLKQWALLSLLHT